MREREETRDRKERQGDVDDTDDLLRSLMDLSEQKDLLERERERREKRAEENRPLTIGGACEEHFGRHLQPFKNFQISSKLFPRDALVSCTAIRKA